MRTKYEPPHRKTRPNKTTIRLTACIALLCCITLLRVFFPGATAAMRATVLPILEENIDYRGAITAIGETLTGDVPLLEALGEVAIRAFGGIDAEDMEVAALPEEPMETPVPEPTPQPEPTATPPPIEEVFPVPAMPALAPPPPPEPPEAVAVFLAHQEPFSERALPVNVSTSYAPLGLEVALPVRGAVSSPFGFRWHPLHGEVRFHFGTDIAADSGTPFVAFADGRVLASQYGAGWGNYILLYHGGGVYTRYAHASALYVRAGETVERGQMIGRVGMTGGATGPHLHFELRVDEMYRNPEFYLTFQS